MRPCTCKHTHSYNSSHAQLCLSLSNTHTHAVKVAHWPCLQLFPPLTAHSRCEAGCDRAALGGGVVLGDLQSLEQLFYCFKYVCSFADDLEDFMGLNRWPRTLAPNTTQRRTHLWHMKNMFDSCERFIMMVFFIFYVEHFLQAFHHPQWQSDVLGLKQKLSLKEIQEVKSILNCMQGNVMTRYKDFQSRWDVEEQRPVSENCRYKIAFLLKSYMEDHQVIIMTQILE